MTSTPASTAAFVIARGGSAGARPASSAAAPAAATRARMAAVVSANWGRSASSRPLIHEIPVRRVNSHPPTATPLTANSAAAAGRPRPTKPPMATAAWATARAMNSRLSVTCSAWIPAAAACTTAAPAEAIAATAKGLDVTSGWSDIVAVYGPCRRRSGRLRTGAAACPVGRRHPRGIHRSPSPRRATVSNRRRRRPPSDGGDRGTAAPW